MQRHTHPWFHRAALAVVLFVIGTHTSTVVADTPATYEVVTRADVSFQPLNPARGDAGPKAGVLWGDLKQSVPTGTLIVFADGFSSPPHIHNITYRAVVIEGEVHNDDPSAEPMWMGPGTFWTQPAGESHITATPAGGGGATAFLEIFEGPYLVRPAEQAYDNGERPVNVDARNIVWLGSSDLAWVETDGPKVAFLWGEPADGKTSGTFLKLPAGFEGDLHATGGTRAVVIGGRLDHRRPDQTDPTTLEPGSYFGSTGSAVHTLSCGDAECVVYVRTEGPYRVTGR